jgi:hypothetical protein
MAAKGSGVSKAGKATTPAGSNGAPVATAKAKPVPAKVVRNLAALGEPHRLAVLGVVAAATAPVTLADVAGRLESSDEAAVLVVDYLKKPKDCTEAATLAVTWLKQRGWIVGERLPKGSGGGGWRYRLSVAGRERLMALGS